MKKNDMVPKAVTIRKDQDAWLKKSGSHINLSGLLQKAIDGEMGKGWVGDLFQI
jgi:hypothetical protein